jgi:hypothetical protein
MTMSRKRHYTNQLQKKYNKVQHVKQKEQRKKMNIIQII